MTKDQKDGATLVIYAVFCAAMLGVYAWSCWQGNRRLARLNAELIADAAAARVARYEPLLRPVPVPPKRRPRAKPGAAAADGSADDQV